MPNTNRVKHSRELARIFPPEAIVVGLKDISKQEAVSALVRHLVTLHGIPRRDESDLVTAIWARENLGTTALGNGVAFPHARTRLAKKLLGVLGLAPNGISFDSLDRSPVYGVFLLLAPEEVTNEYFEVLGRITAVGKDKSLRLQLRGCSSPQAVHRFLRELDVEQVSG